MLEPETLRSQTFHIGGPTPQPLLQLADVSLPPL